MDNISVLQGSEMPSQHCASCNFQEELQKAPRFLRGIGSKASVHVYVC